MFTVRRLLKKSTTRPFAPTSSNEALAHKFTKLICIVGLLGRKKHFNWELEPLNSQTVGNSCCVQVILTNILTFEWDIPRIRRKCTAAAAHFQQKSYKGSLSQSQWNKLKTSKTMEGNGNYGTCDCRKIRRRNVRFWWLPESWNIRPSIASGGLFHRNGYAIGSASRSRRTRRLMHSSRLVLPAGGSSTCGSNGTRE